MIGAGTGTGPKPAALAKSSAGTPYSTRGGIPPYNPPQNSTNYVINPTDKDMQGKVLEQMKTQHKDQMGLAKYNMKWNGGLQAGKLAVETLTKSMDAIFTHVANMKQMNVYNNYLNKQHDIARRSIGLESKKLDVQKEMHNDQLRFQLKVAQHQKETAVTITAIQEKGKTKRVQALAALRTVYGRGKPVSPFQRSMS